MTTRASMNDFMNKAETAVDYAHEQLDTWKKQEHYNEDDYNKAQQELENIHNDLDNVMLSGNGEQKERIRRMQILIRQVQNDLVLNQQDLHPFYENK
jgi:ClpP class serine protease